MTQANNRHGADWTKAPGDGDGPPRGGTESNRARAARGGWGLGPLLAAAPKAEPAPVVFDDTPRPSAGTINFQWNGHDYEVPYESGDTSAQLAAKVAAATGGKVSGSTVEMPDPPRPTSAAWSGAVPGPVVSLPSTLAEAERLYGKGSPVWEAVRARDLAGVTPPLAGANGPLQHGRHISGHREMVAAYGGTGRCPTPEEAEQLYGRGSDMALRVRAAWEASPRGVDGQVVPPEMVPARADLDAQREAIAADNRIRARAGLPLLDVPHPAPGPAPGRVCHATPSDFGALPNPAPGQVWIPPAGEWADRFVDADGTVIVATADGTTVTFGGGGGCKDADMDGPANGWTCIGVATPHGRVMVGDAFTAHQDWPEWTVTRLALTPGSVMLSAPGQCECSNDAAQIAATWTRTCYAPARAGERYASREVHGHVVVVSLSSRGEIQIGDEHGGCVHAPGHRLDPAQWERLDPGASDDGSFRLTPEQIDGVVAGYMSVIFEHQRVVNQALAACSPLTATGEDLDRQARLYGLDRRPAQATAYRGGADGETDESLRARCLERLGLPGGREPAFDYGGNIKGPLSVDYDVATKTITRIHLAAGQTYVSGKGTDLRRYTLVRTDDGEAWATEEGIVVLESFIREACRFVGMKADLLAARAPTAYEHAAAELRKRDLALSVGADMWTIGAPAPSTATITLQAPAPDIRALFDAIGRALELPEPVALTFNGAALTIARDEMLFTPTHVTGFAPTPAEQPLVPFGALTGDARTLRALRATVGEAMATGAASLAQWGAKGPALVVRREGPPIATPVAAEPVEATRYDGANGGADQWRWTPRGEGC